MKKTDQNFNYFPALTGLRAIAAYLVFCHHYNPISKEYFGIKIYNFFSELHIGVTLFFVLSGFLITHRYYSLPKINFKHYLINRFARIYPMYFIITTLTFAFFALADFQNLVSNLKIYILNITFLRGFFDDFKFTGIAQGWSLTVEEVFYFLAPLFFVLIKRKRVFLILLPIFLLVFAFFIVNIFQNINFYGFMKSINFMLDFTFFGRCLEFFIGMGLAIYLNKFKNISSSWLTYVGLIMIIIFVYLLSILKINGVGYGTDCMFGKIINTLLLPLFGVVPLFVGLIFERTVISRLLETKLFELLGKSSYIFYLIHLGIFVAIVEKFWDNKLFLFVILNMISVILYWYIETPLNKFFKNRLNR